MDIKGGFPPINKNKMPKKTRAIIDNKKNEKTLKKSRFTTTKIDNVNINDILSFVKIKKEDNDIINNDNIEVVSSI